MAFVARSVAGARVRAQVARRPLVRGPRQELWRAPSSTRCRWVMQTAEEHGAVEWPDDPDMDVREILDRASRKILAVIVEREVEVDGVTYFVTTPRDRPVLFAVPDEGGRPVPVEDDEVSEAVFDDAQRYLSEDGVRLVKSAYMTTLDEGLDLDGGVRGDMDLTNGMGEDEDKDFGEDVDVEEFDDDAEEDSAEAPSAGEDDGEHVEVVCSFYSAGDEYLLVSPLDPILFIARLGAGKELEVPDQAELDRVQPAIEREMELALPDSEALPQKIYLPITQVR